MVNSLQVLETLCGVLTQNLQLQVGIEMIWKNLDFKWSDSFQVLLNGNLFFFSIQQDSEEKSYLHCEGMFMFCTVSLDTFCSSFS